jgi:hypothetical protein
MTTAPWVGTPMTPLPDGEPRFLEAATDGRAGAIGRPRPGARSVRLRSVDLALFFVGAVITAGSYGELAPVASTGLLFAVGWLGLRLTPAGGVAESRLYTRAFAVFFFVSGIAAVYANQWSDPVQLLSDAATFHAMASGLASGLSLDQISTEGALAVVVWRAVYDGFSQLGFDKARYIGIGVNILAVALSGVVGVKMVRNLYGDDTYRFNRLTWLVSTSGLFWLFAGLHLRDAFVLLTVSVLTYAWQRYLASPTGASRLLVAVAWSALSFIYLGYLRREFAFVPVAMAVAAAASVFTARANPGRRVFVGTLAICAASLSGILIWQFSGALQTAISGGAESYAAHMNASSVSSSLGLRLIVNQPAAIRIVLGGLYLFAFPIPVWTGFQLHSAYHLFISINTVGFYFLTPLLLLAMREPLRDHRQRRPEVLFLVYLTVGFTAAIALTSLEIRHLGAFLMAALVLGTVPDLRSRSGRAWYRRVLLMELSLMAVVHGAWVILKTL